MAALKHAGRHRAVDRAAEIKARLDADQLAQPSVIVDAYAATVQATVAVIGT